ncbi:MAG: nucleotidyltransferase family protein [Bacteroides sp.]|nr:nucleotidyltransferase family protein [Bacteroides sp.]
MKAIRNSGLKRSEALLLEFLRAALWEKPAAPEAYTEGTIAWKELTELAAKQSVKGMVCHVAGLLPEAQMPPRDLRLQMHFYLLRNAQTHDLLNKRLAEVVTLCKEHGLHPVLLKGQGLAANYPIPTLRQCGDIDLYIGRQDYAKACGLIDGLVEEKAREKASETFKHYHIRYKEVDLELHATSERLNPPRYDRFYQRWSARQLSPRYVSRLTFEGVEVEVPPVEFNTLYIFSHIWHHFTTSGIGLRQLCDWVLYLHRHAGEIDADRLEYNLLQVGLMRPWRIFGCLAVSYLGLPREEFPQYKAGYDRLARKALKRIMREGNFGRDRDLSKKRRSISHPIIRKIHSLGCHARRFIVMMPYSPTYACHDFRYVLTNGISSLFKERKA